MRRVDGVAEGRGPSTWGRGRVGGSRRTGRALGRVILLAAGTGAASHAPLDAQTLRGRVLDALDERPVAGALVELVDTLGGRRAVAISDTAGAYRLTAAAPGFFHVQAERIGFADYRSALLELSSPAGTYRADLLMPRAPVPLPGLEVTAERRAEIERSVRLEIGLSPRSLRHDLILRPEIESHLDRAHDLDDLVRWSNLPGVTVVPTEDGACYQVRRGGCLAVYLNGWRLRPETVGLIPLEIAETIVVVMPLESILYEGGAVLLYSAGWLR